ncbi:MAG: hypothetical protein VKP62_02450 [Candidatus Sericytochromatia bacterium]|nr:hypothetical protein [Candidatus Sericytochromatia bacterium]
MSKKPASYLAGSVLLGTAIGTVIGLLAAPMAGREVRGLLRRRASEAGRRIPQGLQRLPGVSEAKAARSELQERLVKLSPRLTQGVRDWLATRRAGPPLLHPENETPEPTLPPTPSDRDGHI